MASPSLFSISALSYLIVFFSVNPYASLGSSEKVEVSLYYETLCPFCANFIVNHLVKIFQNGLISAVNLRLVPWGNAWTNPNGSVICQVTPLSQFLFSFLSCGFRFRLRYSEIYCCFCLFCLLFCSSFFIVYRFRLVSLFNSISY